MRFTFLLSVIIGISASNDLSFQAHYDSCEQYYSDDEMPRYNICEMGEKMVSIATLLADCGVTIEGELVNPRSLNNYLIANEGYPDVESNWIDRSVLDKLADGRLKFHSSPRPKDAEAAFRSGLHLVQFSWEYDAGIVLGFSESTHQPRILNARKGDVIDYETGGKDSFWAFTPSVHCATRPPVISSPTSIDSDVIVLRGDPPGGKHPSKWHDEDDSWSSEEQGWEPKLSPDEEDALPISEDDAAEMEVDKKWTQWLDIRGITGVSLVSVMGLLGYAKFRQKA